VRAPGLGRKRREREERGEGEEGPLAAVCPIDVPSPIDVARLRR
jgi:hypothetical protein